MGLEKTIWLVFDSKSRMAALLRKAVTNSRASREKTPYQFWAT